jgi:hypothetical protein
MKTVPNWIYYSHDFFWIFLNCLSIFLGRNTKFGFILILEKHWHMGPSCQRLSRHAPCADWLPGVALSVTRVGIIGPLRQHRSELPSSPNERAGRWLPWELHPALSCAVRSPLRRLPPEPPAVSAVITRSRSSLPSARGISPPCAPVPKLTEATPTAPELHLLTTAECARLFFPAGRAQLPSPFSPRCRFPSKGPSTDRAGRR